MPTTTFVDSSALYALLDQPDRFNQRALEAWSQFAGGEELLTHNYVLLETSALLQSRIGTDPVRALHDEIVPALTVHWVDQDLHDDAARLVAATRQRSLSLVDHVSFLVMRRFGISRAFAFDPHFADEGFELVG